jgi:hypothetical protein
MTVVHFAEYINSSLATSKTNTDDALLPDTVSLNIEAVLLTHTKA